MSRGYTVGWLRDEEFVCVQCIDGHEDLHEGHRWHGCDQRLASGRECSRCERRMEHLATVRLLPDGASSMHTAPDARRPQGKIVRTERDEAVLVDRQVLVYIEVHGGGPEVGLWIGADGKVEVWVHDDPVGDGVIPSGRWEHPPGRSVLREQRQGGS